MPHWQCCVTCHWSCFVADKSSHLDIALKVCRHANYSYKAFDAIAVQFCWTWTIWLGTDVFLDILSCLVWQVLGRLVVLVEKSKQFWSSVILWNKNRESLNEMRQPDPRKQSKASEAWSAKFYVCCDVDNKTRLLMPYCTSVPDKWGERTMSQLQSEGAGPASWEGSDVPVGQKDYR